VAIYAAAVFLVLRKWLGPSNFVEGSPPPATHGGLASVDEIIYIFGGNSNNGFLLFKTHII
jgi:hypothetical protein